MKYTLLNTIEYNQLVTGFEKEMIKENKSDWFVYENVSCVKEFLQYAEQTKKNTLKAITQQTANDYFNYLQNKRINQRKGGTLSSNTIDKHHCAINNFLKYLEAEKLAVNAITLKRKKRIKEKTIFALSHEEIKQLYSITDTSFFGYRDRCMLALYYGCGIRKSEGLKLLITDLDFTRGWIRIRKSKNNRERYVMMTPKVQKYIEEYVYQARELYLQEDSPYEHLFISERGVPMHPETLAHRIEQLWKRVQERYGNDKWIGCHTLRHTLGTHLYMAGMKIERIALMLGHRSLESTQLYIHLAQRLTTSNQQPTTMTNNHEQI